MNKIREEFEKEVSQEAHDKGYQDGLRDGTSEKIRDLQEQIGYLKGDVINVNGVIKSRDEEIKDLLFNKKVNEKDRVWNVKYKRSLIEIIEEVIQLDDLDYITTDLRERAKQTLLGNLVATNKDEEIKKLRDALEKVNGAIEEAQNAERSLHAIAHLLAGQKIISEALKES